MASFIDHMFSRFQQYPQSQQTAALAEAFSRKFVHYFHTLHAADIKRGKVRKLPPTSSAQSYLSVFKKKIQASRAGAPAAFLKGLHLTQQESKALMVAKSRNVYTGAIDLPAVNGDGVITDCRKLLTSPNPYLKVIALACLTGRRTAEIVFTIRLGPPTEKHKTSGAYWARASGFCKQRTDPIVSREVPLLENRDTINRAIAAVRRELKVRSVGEVNKRFSKPIQRAIKKFCPAIGKVHQFRKFYALCCFKYFNDRHCSLPRIAADYLGHKTVSATVLTYLNFRVNNLGELSFR